MYLWLFVQEKVNTPFKTRQCFSTFCLEYYGGFDRRQESNQEKVHDGNIFATYLPYRVLLW